MNKQRQMDLTLAIYQGLDWKNDEHWSLSGLPSRSAVAYLTGNPEITREEIEAAAPGYRRKSAESKIAFTKE